jgi:hypothetical protein
MVIHKGWKYWDMESKKYDQANGNRKYEKTPFGSPIKVGFL